jgi:tetratricopeptide (TPR) repeat protein
MPVKGLAEPVDVFELLGATPARRRFQAAVARGLTRFVGRDQELAVLRRARALAAQGQGQLVALLGEAGVGKSRLVHEFVHDHATQGWRVLESASVSYGKATPYYPVIDLLRRYAHLDDSDDARTIRAKVTGQVLTLDETLQDTLLALLALLDALPDDSPFRQLDPAQRRQRTLTALQRVLLRESQVQPLLLVFEDLHWIDTETQALLDLLTESLPTTPLLLLVNYRPEYQHGWGSKTYYTQLRLDPLPSASADALLQALLGDDASLTSLTQLLITRTAGNPFFLEESVQTLREAGILVGELGAYRLLQPLQHIQMPATVQAVLAARIDRLSPEDKHLLQTAAVLGHEVPLPLLQAITELPEAELYRGLAHLQAAEFLYETRLFPERAFTFKHALTHEVAYSSLLQERRRVLHARIVETLEALTGDRLAEQIERLAHHALRGEVWEKALAYYRQAGDKAMTRSAFREAVACFEQALTALRHLPEQRHTQEQAIDLRYDLGNALQALGEFERRLTYLREAETLAEVLRDQRRLGELCTNMTHAFWTIGDYDHALTYSQRALTLAAATGDAVQQARVNGYLGTIYFSLGDYRRAIEVFRQAIPSYEGESRQERFRSMMITSARDRLWLLQCCAEVGAFVEGIAYGAEAARIAETAGHLTSTVMTQDRLGLIALYKGDLQQAIFMLEHAFAQCRAADIPLYLPAIMATLGLVYARSGQITKALPLLDQVEVRQSTGGGGYRIMLHLGEGYLLVGRMEDAHCLAERLLTLSRDHKERGNQAWALWLLGEIAAQRHPPDPAQAEAHYRQALALADELGMRPLQAHCHHGLGMLYATTSQREQARAELSTAIAMYQSMDMTFWLPQTEAALAQVEGR